MQARLSEYNGIIKKSIGSRDLLVAVVVFVLAFLFLAASNASLNQLMEQARLGELAITNLVFPVGLFISALVFLLVGVSMMTPQWKIIVQGNVCVLTFASFPGWKSTRIISSTCIRFKVAHTKSTWPKTSILQKIDLNNECHYLPIIEDTQLIECLAERLNLWLSQNSEGGSSDISVA